MKEKLSYKGEREIYQPRIREVRVRGLHEMSVYTGRYMTVLLDEALSIFLSTFLTSEEYVEWCEEIERRVDEYKDEKDYPDLEDYDTIWYP